MSVQVLVHKELNLVYTKFWGFVAAHEIEKAMFDTLEHADYSPGMLELTDLSGVEGTDLDLESLETQTSRSAAYYEINAEQTSHFVFAPTDLSFDLAQEHFRRVQSEIDNLKVSLFRSEIETLRAMGSKAKSIAELLDVTAR